MSREEGRALAHSLRAHSPLWQESVVAGECGGRSHLCSVGKQRVDTRTLSFSFTPGSLPTGWCHLPSRRFFPQLPLLEIPSWTQPEEHLLGGSKYSQAEDEDGPSH